MQDATSAAMVVKPAFVKIWCALDGVRELRYLRYVCLAVDYSLTVEE